MIANATLAGPRRLLVSLLLIATAGLAQAATPLGAPFTISSRYDGSLFDVARSPTGSFVVAWSEDRSTPNVGRSELYLQTFRADGTPYQAAFRVEAPGVYDGILPALATDANGGFVLVWLTIGPNEGLNRTAEYYAQRFSAAGARIGAQQHVAHIVDYNLPRPSVAMAADGSYVVAWQTMPYRPLIKGVNSVNTVTTTVHARQYGANGQPRGEAITVDTGLPLNPNLAFYPYNVSVGIDASGAFAVAYEVHVGASSSIQLKRYSAEGKALGLRQRVSPLADQWAIQPRMLLNPDGSAVVAWCECRQPSLGDNVAWFQRYGADGKKQGTAISLQTPLFPVLRESTPHVASGPNNSFLVLWRADVTPPGQAPAAKAMGQAYRADGTPEGATFLLQDDTQQGELLSLPASDASGNFVAVWMNNSPVPQSTSVLEIKARLFLRQ